jgi:hypothetical protein
MTLHLPALGGYTGDGELHTVMRDVETPTITSTWDTSLIQPTHLEEFPHLSGGCSVHKLEISYEHS